MSPTGILNIAKDSAHVTLLVRDGYYDAQNRNSPAYACVGHSTIWCSGYNEGFSTGNDGSNIFYGQRTDQSGDKEFTSEHKSTGDMLPDCAILCLNSDIRIK